MPGPSLSTIDNSVQLRLKNLTNSSLSQSTRLEAYNRVLDFLQSKANWNFTRRVQPFYLLNREADYHVVNDIGISDLKQIEDLRYISTDRQYKQFEEIDGDEFSIMERQLNFNNVYSLEERDNVLMLRILADRGEGDSILDDMDDLTTGRTWASDTSTSDATTLAQDTAKAINGNSLRFNISASQSSNNRAAIYTSTVFSTVIDASADLNIGYFRFWLGLHSMSAANLARMSGVTFVWGSDASATPATKTDYWSLQATTPLSGAFKAGWNRMSYNWANAAQTGSPDSSSLRYFEIQLDYTSALTNTNNIRVDQIKRFSPIDVELAYFSTFMVSNSGTLQTGFSTVFNGAETILMPQRHINLFISLALLELVPQKDKITSRYTAIQKEANERLGLAINLDGNAITRESNTFQIDGESSGREDVSNNQW